MSELEPEYPDYYPNRKSRVPVISSLLGRHVGLNHDVASFLTYYETGQPVPTRQTDPIEMLGEYLSFTLLQNAKDEYRRMPGPDGSMVLSAFNPWKWGCGFIAEMLGELRTIICGTKSKYDKLEGKSQASIAAIAALLTHKFGVADPASSAIAVLVLLSLARATKKAFCHMTDAEVLTALKESTPH